VVVIYSATKRRHRKADQIGFCRGPEVDLKRHACWL
jgi:hypothetical protein